MYFVTAIFCSWSAMLWQFQSRVVQKLSVYGGLLCDLSFILKTHIVGCHVTASAGSQFNS